MEPHTEHSTSWSLPQPADREQGSIPPLPAGGGYERLPEAPRPAPAEQSGGAVAAPIFSALQAIPADPVQQRPMVAVADPSSGPAVASDDDLIEKEWVAKAKEIVERTREDPHQQTRELTKVKANYLQKRYNKVLKVSD